MDKEKSGLPETLTEGGSSAPKSGLVEYLSIQGALDQICNHKKEVIIAFTALFLYAVATLLITDKITQLLEQPVALITPAHHPIAPVIIASLVLFLSLAALFWTLFSLAHPLRKRIVVARLVVLAVAAVLVTFAKSLILGYFARLLFQGDLTRFELAKTGVDHLSSLLGIAFAAAVYVLLVRCLKEEKLTFAGFGKSYGILFVWIAAIYLVKFVALSLLPSHLAINSVAALLSALAAIWYVALALALQKESAEKQEPTLDPELESNRAPDQEPALEAESELQKDAS